MTSADVVRQLKAITVEITEMSAEEVEEIWPWAYALADAVDALRAGRRLKPYDETGGHSAGQSTPPLDHVRLMKSLRPGDSTFAEGLAMNDPDPRTTEGPDDGR